MLSIQLRNIALKNFSLNNITFNLKKGQLLSILGQNGSGKTSLLKSIAGIYNGDIEVLWKEKTLAHTAIEYIPSFIQPQLSLETRFFLEASLEKIKPSHEDLNRLAQVARFLRIENLLKKDLKTLSSGETVKILLAKALLSRKPIILWDEPTSFLDLKYRFFLQKFVLYLKRNKILILSTHDIKWAKKISDFYLGLKQGRQDFFSDQLEKGSLKKLLLT